MKSLNIRNFRCFDNLEVQLKPGINLFIGDNASGKTSLLLACMYVADCFFSGFSDKFTTWVTPNANDFMISLNGEKRLKTLPIDIAFEYETGEENFSLAGVSQRLYKKSEKNSRPWLSLLSALRQYAGILADNYIVKNPDGSFSQPYSLPLIASFSTHGIHNHPKIISRYFNEAAQTPSFGYYMCHATDGLLEHWVRRILILTEADYNIIERRIVITALEKMFGPEGCNVINRFDVRVNYKDIVCIFNDGREIPVSLLSDGYKRLFSIVIDIAFRCALLNSLKFGLKAADMTRGTVIIDEIDLHLHPSLQALVLKALHNTFPKLQFIVSTHAPMVMSGVESNDENTVQYMAYSSEEKAYSVVPVQTYGMDISTLASTVLLVPKRDPSTEKELQALINMVDREEFDAANVLLKSLKEKYDNRIPELRGIETQIIFEQSLK